jgi:hypothetical protein
MKRSCLILTAAMALTGCGIDPIEDPTFSSSTDELSAGAKTDPAALACFADSQGGPTSCKPLATWKQHAIDACAAKGMEVSRIDYADSCGTDQTRYEKYVCCPKAPPPPPPACFTDSQGDATSCKPSATWKQYASDACAAKGAVLTKIDYADSCGTDLFRYTKYECCPNVQPPPPPPPACFAAVVDHKPNCVADEKLKIEASEVCKAKGQTLVAINYLDECPNAGPLPMHMAAEFKCCP